MSSAATASFQARNRDFLLAREKRLDQLRQENLQRELAEATFRPAIGTAVAAAKVSGACWA